MSSPFEAVKMLKISTFEVISGSKLDLVGTKCSPKWKMLNTFQNNRDKSKKIKK